MDQILVRQMQHEDIESVIKIYSEVFDGNYVGFGELAVGMGIAPGVSSEQAPNLFREELNNLLGDTAANGLFVAMFDDHIIGFAVAVLQSNSTGLECWLNDLGVDKGWHRQGVGRQLVDRVLVWALDERKARCCLLESGVRNETAHKLFEHMGFHPLSTVFWKGSPFSNPEGA